MGVNKRNNLRREIWDARRNARLHFECDRKNHKESVEAAKINERCSQPSGEVQGGCVSNLLKPALSTGQRINSRQFHEVTLHSQLSTKMFLSLLYSVSFQ
jgi:hypothetical protein